MSTESLGQITVLDQMTVVKVGIHFVLQIDLREKAFQFSLLSMILAVSLPHVVFIMLRYVLSTSSFLTIFIMKRC